MRPPRRYRRAVSGSGGFSLCEVALAIGIFVFVLISLLGVLPSILSSSRSSQDLSLAVGLADKLAGEFARADFASLSAATTCYYDDLGNRVSDSSSAIYFVTVEPTDSVSRSLKNIRINVTRGTNQTTSRAFSYLIFDQGT